MEVSTFNQHLEGMKRLEAMEHLKELRISQFPHLKEDAQTKYHKEIHKKAFPVQKVYSFDEIEKALGLK